MGFLNLEDQFSFYLAYHSHRVNTAIHIVFVWPIFFTALVLLAAFTMPVAPTPHLLSSLPGGEYFILNAAFFVAAFYAAYYFLLDRKAGLVGALLAFSCWIGAEALVLNLGVSAAWKVALAGQLVSWISQFIGHGAFEGRAPALLDNLSQALLMAPFFVLLEVLQEYTGYEPSPGFGKRVHERAAADIRAYRLSKEKKVE